jgi:hypothetical protein
MISTRRLTVPLIARNQCQVLGPRKPFQRVTSTRRHCLHKPPTFSPFVEDKVKGKGDTLTQRGRIPWRRLARGTKNYPCRLATTFRIVLVSRIFIRKKSVGESPRMTAYVLQNILIKGSSLCGRVAEAAASFRDERRIRLPAEPRNVREKPATTDAIV